MNWHLLVPRMGAAPGWGSEKFLGVGCLLAQGLGEPVLVLPVPDVATALDESGREAHTLAWARPLDVLSMLDGARGGVVAFAEFEGSGWFRPMIVARPDDAGRAPPWPAAPAGSRIMMGIDTQLAQWILPLEAAIRQGMRVEERAAIRRDPSPAAAMRAVLRGEVEYGATYDRALRSFLRAPEVDAAGLVIAWASDPVPYDAIVVSPQLSPENVARLRRALLAPTGGYAGSLPAGYTGFALARDADYETLRQRVRAFTASR